MKNHEKIKFFLEMGVYKGVEVFSLKLGCVEIESYDGMYLKTSHGTMLKEDIDSLVIHSITPIPNPPKLLPLGTKVRVFEEYRILYDTRLFVIENAVTPNSYYILRDFETNKIINDEVPARAVVPVLE